MYEHTSTNLNISMLKIANISFKMDNIIFLRLRHGVSGVILKYYSVMLIKNNNKKTRKQ